MSLKGSRKCSLEALTGQHGSQRHHGGIWIEMAQKHAVTTGLRLLSSRKESVKISLMVFKYQLWVEIGVGLIKSY